MTKNVRVTGVNGIDRQLIVKLITSNLLIAAFDGNNKKKSIVISERDEKEGNLGSLKQYRTKHTDIKP